MRSSGRVSLRAASTALRTSSRLMSLARCPSVIPPRLFTPRTWLPATPATARSTGTPATPSASSIARRIEVAVAPIFAIKPLRSPLDSAAPMAINFAPVSSASLMTAHVFVLPTSSATKYLSFFVKPPLLHILSRPGGDASGQKPARFLYGRFRTGFTREGTLCATFAATVLVSGFTTTCRANRKSTESTPPALLRH